MYENLKELKEMEEQIKSETINDVIKRISISDSYFYAEMAIMKYFDTMDPFNGEKIKCIIKMNLFNSKNFINTNISNERPKVQTAKEIRVEVILESEDLIRNKEDIMMLIYEETGKQIAQDLFQANAREINTTIINAQEPERRYI